VIDPTAALARDARAERAASELDRANVSEASALREAASKFEAFLLGQIFAQASKPLTQEPLLDGGSATRMYREMYIQEVASRVGSRGGSGLARLLEAGLRNSPDAQVEARTADEVPSALPPRDGSARESA
jgi:Rod binding domain-containing protein